MRRRKNPGSKGGHWEGVRGSLPTGGGGLAAGLSWGRVGEKGAGCWAGSLPLREGQQQRTQSHPVPGQLFWARPRFHEHGAGGRERRQGAYGVSGEGRGLGL